MAALDLELELISPVTGGHIKVRVTGDTDLDEILNLFTYLGTPEAQATFLNKLIEEAFANGD